MKNNSRVTPEGTRDILFDECRSQREAERKLTHLFSSWGYNEVLTPGYEFFDLFRLPGASVPVQEMYKTIDRDGHLLVMRADSTLPIARLAASRLKDAEMPIRLFYNQSIYRSRPELSGRNHEKPQMGIELLGINGIRSDLEAIALAVEALSTCVCDFRLEIGHAALFQSLIQKLEVSVEHREEIRRAVENKNHAQLKTLLRDAQHLPVGKALLLLPRLFGGEEVLTQAEVCCFDEDATIMLTYLKHLFQSLSALGLGDKLMVDLGMANKNDYYTGVLFSAYAPQIGEPLLVGGRYDNLLEKFGMPMPAIGFSVDIYSLVQIELAQTLNKQADRADVLVFAEDGFEIEALRRVNDYAKAGVHCAHSLSCTWEETLSHARRLHIPFAERIGGETERVELGVGEE